MLYAVGRLLARLEMDACLEQSGDGGSGLLRRAAS